MSESRQTEAATPGADLILGAAMLAFAGLALALVPAEVADDGWNQIGNVRSPAFFPLLASGLLAMLSLGLILRAARGGAFGALRRGRVGIPGRRVVGVALALGLGGVAVFWLGFLVTGALLIAALSWVLGERRPAVVVALAVAVPVAIHLLFRTVLSVLLPAGIF